MRLELDPKGISFRAADNIDDQVLVEMKAKFAAHGIAATADDGVLRVNVAGGITAVGEAFKMIYEGLLSEGVKVVRAIVYADDPKNIPRLCRDNRTPF